MTEQNAHTPKKPMTKTEVTASLAAAAGLTKQQVVSLFDELAKLIGSELGDAGAGVFNISNLLKIKVVCKPATPERKASTPSRKRKPFSRRNPPPMWSR